MRGDIYRYKGHRDARGHVQQGPRYVVVLQADDLPLSTWLVAPTSTGRRGALFRPEIEVRDDPTRVCLEQLLAVDPQSRLGEYVGTVTRDELAEIDDALRMVLALD